MSGVEQPDEVEGHETLAAAARALVEAAERAPMPEVWEDALGGEGVSDAPQDEHGLMHSALAELRALAGADGEDGEDDDVVDDGDS